MRLRRVHLARVGPVCFFVCLVLAALAALAAFGLRFLFFCFCKAIGCGRGAEAPRRIVSERCGEW